MYRRNKAKYSATWQFLSDLNIALGGNIDQREENKFSCWSPNEEISHRIVKWMVFDILIQRGHKVFVEKQLGGGIFDVMDASEQVIYEIETKKSEEIYKKKIQQFNSFLIKDLVIIYLEDLPKEWEAIYEKLKEIL